DATGLKARAAARLPVVMPEHGAIAGVDREDVVRRSRVDHAVDEEDAAAGRALLTAIGLARAETADDDRRAAAATTTSAPATTPPRPAAPPAPRATAAARIHACRPAAGREIRDPLEAEVLDRRRVDELQRAEALAAEITRVAAPFSLERLDDVGRVESADL